MSDGRKPRSDSKLRSLSADEKTRLTDWLIEHNLSYDEVVKRVSEEFGIQTSRGAVSHFFQKECFHLRFRKAKNDADQVKQLFEQTEESFGESALNAISQRVFELSIARDGDVSDLVSLAKVIGDSERLRLKSEQLEIDKRKLKMLEAKVAAHEKQSEVLKETIQDIKNKGLSQEALERIEDAANLL